MDVRTGIVIVAGLVLYCFACWLVSRLMAGSAAVSAPGRVPLTQSQRVKLALDAYPGLTSRELARVIKADPYMVARRLVDLYHQGWARQGTKVGRCHTWYPLGRR